MGNPAVVGGRRVFLVRQMAAPTQQLSEQPWTLDSGSAAGSRSEKIAYNRMQNQRYQRCCFLCPPVLIAPSSEPSQLAPAVHDG